MTGSEITPMATTDAPTTPVAAASKAPTKTMVVSRSSASRARSSTIPIKMKNGTASRT
jgi:hypothetical protein